MERPNEVLERFPGNRRGVSLAELIVAVAILSLLAAVFLKYQRESGHRTEGDSASAAYYTDLGFFLEQFHTDTRSAFRIRAIPGGCTMETRHGSSVSEITYKLAAENTILRCYGNATKTFRFSSPTKEQLKFVFETKEETP